MSIKILGDPCYLNMYPFHLIPRILQNFRVPGSGLFALRNGNVTGPFPHWALGADGYDGMDLGFTYTHLFRSDLSLREEVLSQYRQVRWPIYAFHATFEGGAPFLKDTALNLTKDEERTRRGLKNHIRAAGEIGGPDTILVLHLGISPAEKEKCLEGIARLLSSYLPLAEEKQVILAVENMPGSVRGKTPLGADYRDLKNLLEMIPSPYLKICLDLGHANSYAEFFARQEGRMPLDEYVKGFGYCREMIQELGKEIVYAHVHYNRSHIQGQEVGKEKKDEHMPLTHIPMEHWDAYSRILQLMIQETSITRTKRVNLELIPRRFFGCFTVFPTGGCLSESLESARVLRKILNGHSGSHHGNRSLQGSLG